MTHLVCQKSVTISRGAEFCAEIIYNMPYFSRRLIKIRMAIEEEKMPGRLSSAKEVLLLLLLGVVGQIFDSYSDIGLSYRFYKGTPYNGKF